MSFFGNRAINRLNLHYGLQQLAESAGGVFYLVFLLKAGVSVPVTLCANAAIVAQRFAIRPAVLPLAHRIGLRRTLIAGTFMEAIAFPLLAEVSGLNWAFWALLFITPIGSVLYWTCFHAYFATLGDAEHRGGQVGAREALAALVGIVGPLVGGWLLITSGPRVAFWIVAALQVLAAAPLVGAPDVAVAKEAPGGFRAARLGATLLMTDGWFAAGYHYVWQIALFVALDESYAAYGGAMALAAGAGAVCGLVIGRRIDLGHGRTALVIACAVAAAVVALRAASLDSPWLAVTANALGAIVVALWIPALMTPVYNLAKASPCPVRFHVATEGGWDIGCGLGCLAAAGLVASGHALSPAILLPLGGLLVAFGILWRHYGGVAEGRCAPGEIA